MKPLSPREFLGVMAKLAGSDAGLIGELLAGKGNVRRGHFDPAKATVNTLHKGDNAVVQVNDGAGFPKVETQPDGGAKDNAKSASEIYLGWLKEALVPGAYGEQQMRMGPGMPANPMMGQQMQQRVARTAPGAPGGGGAGVTSMTGMPKAPGL